MAKFDDFLNELNVILPGIARPIARPAIYNIVRDFCQFSRIWQLTLTGEYTGDAGELVDIAARHADEISAVQGQMVDVLSVVIDGEPVRLSTGFDRVARTGFIPKFNIRSQYTVTVTLLPVRGATELPQHLVDDWEVTIANGVAYRLAMQPGQDWTQPQLAQVYRQAYEEGKNRALFEANNDRQTQRVVKHNFFGG